MNSFKPSGQGLSILPSFLPWVAKDALQVPANG